MTAANRDLVKPVGCQRSAARRRGRVSAPRDPTPQTSISIFLTAVFSYLLGSIPFGFILVRIFRGKDVRLTGSGNIGATNVARSFARPGSVDAGS